jgi:hypothetical protein
VELHVNISAASKPTRIHDLWLVVHFNGHERFELRTERVRVVPDPERRNFPMIELELATTEQILEELGRRPVKFVHVCTIYKGSTPDDGFIAYSPSLESDDAVWMLRKAQELLEQEEEPPHEQAKR